MQIWQGGDPEWAVCTHEPVAMPVKLCFIGNTTASIQFIQLLQEGARSPEFLKRGWLHRVSSRRLPRISGYFDFATPRQISTAAAVVLAAEYERLLLTYQQVPHTVDLHKWNPEVFRKLYQIGFFEIVGITPGREDVLNEEGDNLTMRIVSTRNADDLEKVDAALQELCAFVGPTGGAADPTIIDLLTGLAEAMSNVTNHAYPPDYSPKFRHVDRLWVAASADRVRKTLTVVVYDQGITIPVTYPRIERIDRVMNFLGRAIRRRREFDYQDDGTYIRAAMKYGGSRTDLKHRGKGLPQIMEVIDRAGRGKIAVFSRGGWCFRDERRRFRSGALPYSIGGTLIEWEVELSGRNEG